MFLYYNRNGIGDVLIVYLNDGDRQGTERKGDIVRIFDRTTGETLGFNFFGISGLISSLPPAGCVAQEPEHMARLNEALAGAGYSDRLETDGSPRIVTGFVERMEKHPDSDHMHVCQVDVGDETLQIVCGAPNIDQGQNVVVAKVGALMPDGLVIRPSVLRGVASNGMICSARELALPGAPKKRGILVLDDSVRPGQNFFVLMAQPIR